MRLRKKLIQLQLIIRWALRIALTLHDKIASRDAWDLAIHLENFKIIIFAMGQLGGIGWGES